MTLVELLMVIAILAIVMAAAAPLMHNTMDGQKVRSAARQVNVFVAGAKSRAAELGRPVGVWIERNNQIAFEGASQSVRMYVAETPPPFTGWFLNAAASIQYETDASGSPTRGIAQFNAASGSVLEFALVGDRIKFDYRGPEYEILETATQDDSQYAYFSVLDESGLKLPLPPEDENTWLPYQIIRAPERSIVSPLKLSPGVVVDLTVSGIGRSGREFRPNGSDDATGVVIMFSPSGHVERLYYGDSMHKPTGTIHLLVGRSEQVDPDNPFLHDDDVDDDGLDEGHEHLIANIMDARNLWVSVGHRTGVVTTSDNNDLQARVRERQEAEPTFVPTDAWRLQTARDFASSAESKGGL